MAGIKEFGLALRQARQEAGLTQEALSRQLGVPYGRITKWERGENVVSEKYLPAILAFMGLTLEEYHVRYLARGRQNGPPPQEEEAAARAARQLVATEEELRVLRALLARLEQTG